MAFLLAQRLEKQIQTKSRLTDDSFNPSNLENLQLPPGVKLPTDWLSFDEQSADAVRRPDDRRSREALAGHPRRR